MNNTDEEIEEVEGDPSVIDLVRPQPIEVKGEAGEVVPGANTVEDITAGEFNHPMFSLTSGVYDGQVHLYFFTISWNITKTGQNGIIYR